LTAPFADVCLGNSIVKMHIGQQHPHAPGYNPHMGKLWVVLVLLFAAAGAAWYVAGRADPPVIEIVAPARLIGQSGDLAVTVASPGGQLTRLDVTLEQGEARWPVFALPGAEPAQLVEEGEHHLRLTRPIGKREVPGLEAGPLTVRVIAVRPVLFGLREIGSSATHEVEVRLTPPQVGVASQFHHINHGGSEMVVYRVRPPDVESGVRVGDYEYRGYPAAGAGIEGADAGLRVAFFALMWDQDVKTPISLYARDEVGNEARASFDYRVFPKTFRKSRISLSDRFLEKVVPEILYNSTELKVDDPSDLLASFLQINRELRRQNNMQIAAMAHETTPEILWQGAFKQLTSTAVEAGFADQRTYDYDGREVDQQVHLGFDLASTRNAPVLAANRGRVLHAGWLGIYGNCVILDHGMGVQSLYAHLSSVDVSVGQAVDKNSRLGLSGETGLAGGDHLHFTMLLAGNPVTPIDWWSPQWIEDRIMRKLRQAGAAVDQPRRSSADPGWRNGRVSRPSGLVGMAGNHASRAMDRQATIRTPAWGELPCPVPPESSSSCKAP
jgi:murein DD-endopeptidase MepM/ murein hydrolase activator NlpD